MKKQEKKITPPSLGFFRFREIDGKMLITNDVGEHKLLDKEDFELLASGELDEKNKHFIELKEMGALRDKEDNPIFIEKYKRKNLFILQGPLLFIVVPTLRCNMKCVYCHASAASPGSGSGEFDMTIETAKRVVDVIFQTPGINISLEFQGGEPLLAWETVKFITNYAIEKNKMHKKNLLITLVSNLTLLDDEKLDFLVDRKVGLSTSLDGPAVLHDKNRGGGSSAVLKKLKKAVKRYRLEFDRYMPGALTTITRHSLPYFKEIIDTYVSLKMDAIHLRPLNPIGFAKPVLDEIGYSAEEYLEFYEKALDYIIELNKKGTFLIDRTAWIYLMKIYGEFDPNYLDLRSPCGAGIGQIAFNYDGNVYTCDEGRMLAVQGDQSFKMGNVFDQSYDDLITAPIVKKTCLASILDGIPHCDHCAYKPYCGVCPLLNYVEEGSLFAKIPQNRRHKINRGALDMIFKRLQDESVKKIFITWLERGINVV